MREEKYSLINIETWRSSSRGRPRIIGLTTCTCAFKLVQRLRFIRTLYSFFPSHYHPALVLMAKKNLIPRRHMRIGVLEPRKPFGVEYR